MKVAQSIGWITFLEIIRDKVLYNVILCFFLLLGTGFLASRLTFLQPERIILDFGLSAVSLSCTIMAVLIGSGILGGEIERRTIYVALSHPISRAQFVVGKFCGLVGVLGVNWILLSGSFLFLLTLTTQQPLSVITSTLFIALILLLAQSILIASISILFSAFSTTSLAVIISTGVYMVGNNISQLKLVSTHIQTSSLRKIVECIAYSLPNLECFNIGSKVTYGLPVTGKFVCLSLLYGALMVILCLILAGVLLQAREV